MRFVIQRVAHASVTVEDECIGSIGKGFLVLVGVEHDDTRQIADKLVSKLVNMRIFKDEQGKTNLALSDVGGSLLIVSQFTLYADCRKGNRPSFTKAADARLANDLYEYVISRCRETVPIVEHGSFGADMKVDLLNDGPFTIILDSRELM